jgi:hypothetical protein
MNWTPSRNSAGFNRPSLRWQGSSRLWQEIPLDVLILVCALSMSAPDCQRASAQHVFYAPPSDSSSANCLREGLMHAAQSHLVTADSYAKVVCQPFRSASSQKTSTTD